MLNNKDKSRELLERSLNILEKSYPFDKITIARVMGNLGLLYNNLDDIENKKNYLSEVLTTFQKKLSSEHIDIKTTINQLQKENNTIILGYPILLLP